MGFWAIVRRRVLQGERSASGRQGGDRPERRPDNAQGGYTNSFNPDSSYGPEDSFAEFGPLPRLGGMSERGARSVVGELRDTSEKFEANSAPGMQKGPMGTGLLADMGGKQTDFYRADSAKVFSTRDRSHRGNPGTPVGNLADTRKVQHESTAGESNEISQADRGPRGTAGSGPWVNQSAPGASSMGQQTASIIIKPTTDGDTGRIGGAKLSNRDIQKNTIDPLILAGIENQPLKDAPNGTRLELLSKKLSLCGIIYDFSDEDGQVREKEIKRQTLLEIVDYINNYRDWANETMAKELINMISCNIFRSLPPPIKINLLLDPAEEEEPPLDPAWFHLQTVYELLLRFIVSNDVDLRIAKLCIDRSFLIKFSELFHAEDPRERDYLKTILHRVYGKVMNYRGFIRKTIQYEFAKFVYETEVHNGIAELLEVLGSIINGYAHPLKKEHKIYMEKVLLPMHKTRSLPLFSTQLTYCMTQFAEKDTELTSIIINGLLRYWPVTNASKVVLFLGELEEVIDLTPSPQFELVMVPVISRLAECMASPHFQIAERALFLWNNEHFMRHFCQYREQLLPLLLSSLHKNTKSHWNAAVQSLTYNVTRLIAETDSIFFDKCSEFHFSNEAAKMSLADANKRKWKALLDADDTSSDNVIVVA